MARPRSPENPVRWPEPCARCGGHYASAARWPDGKICRNCYQQAKRTHGTCPCGHVGVLPDRDPEGTPTCRGCAGITLNVDCRACGAEDELYDGRRCWRCRLRDEATHLLTNPGTGTMDPALAVMLEALCAMERPNSELTWLRQPHVFAALASLARTNRHLDHATLDQLQTSRTREYVRGLLVERGVLPPRDLYLERYEDWSTLALQRVTDPRHADIVKRYIHWHHLRRMNQMDTVTEGTFLRAKQNVTVAITLLNWLSERQVTLDSVSQADLDQWYSQGNSTALLADNFIGWAQKQHLAPSDLSRRQHKRGSAHRLPSAAQHEAITRLADPTPRTKERAAAVLVLIFGQQVEDIVQLTWDDVTIDGERVSIRLGSHAITIPDPLAHPFRELRAERPRTAANQHSNWVFRSNLPGRHQSAASLRTSMQTYISARAARLGTLHELTKTTPGAILADALGYTPETIEKHAKDSATAYSRYIALRSSTTPAE